MDLATFIKTHRPRWRQLEELLRHVEGSGLGALAEEEAIQFGRLYRSAASDLNQAQTFVSGDATVQFLNNLVARCYLVIYGRSKPDVRGLVKFLLWGYPAVFRDHFLYVLLAAAIFLCGALFGFLASSYDAEAARTQLFPEQAHAIQPAAEDTAEPALAPTSGSLAAGSSWYFSHNVSVSLVAFVMGITFGVVTAWMMFYNGVILGVLAAVFVEAGQFKAFCAEVLPHGVLEIPAMLIAGGAGFVLARGLLVARHWPRLQELARSGKQAIFLVAGCIPLLALAGVLEMGVARTSSTYLGSNFKLSVAGIGGILFVAFLLLPGRRHSGFQAESAHVDS